MRAFDSFHSPLEGAFDYEKARIGRVYTRRARRLKPVAEAVVVKGKDPNACTFDEGHWWAIPPPAKGREGETEGCCRYCGRIRLMNNVSTQGAWSR